MSIKEYTNAMTIQSKSGQLRIIGGRWRGRKFSFATIPDLRPTPDRVRETLFNWLAPVIYDAHCIDLFTGSGALALEALSRGAASVVMIDSSHEVIKQLTKLMREMQINTATLYQTTIPDNVMNPPQQPYNIVFLDPPFRQNFIQTCSKWLEATGWLAPETLIYIEAERELNELSLPSNWEIQKHKTAGQVAYYLVKRTHHVILGRARSTRPEDP